MEESSSIEDLESLRKAMRTIKGKFLHLLFDKDHLTELVKMYHRASMRNAEEID